MCKLVSVNYFLNLQSLHVSISRNHPAAQEFALSRYYIPMSVTGLLYSAGRELFRLLNQIHPYFTWLHQVKTAREAHYKWSCLFLNAQH